ncbi:hypothetical protein Bbelb_441290 [Branchiostoma belcheri]|nr:hypothetical protein Bbelb_441290 [Branchiostoma belcheri]
MSDETTEMTRLLVNQEPKLALNLATECTARYDSYAGSRPGTKRRDNTENSLGAGVCIGEFHQYETLLTSAVDRRRRGAIGCPRHLFISRSAKGRVAILGGGSAAGPAQQSAGGRPNAAGSRCNCAAASFLGHLPAPLTFDAVKRHYRLKARLG